MFIEKSETMQNLFKDIFYNNLSDNEICKKYNVKHILVYEIRNKLLFAEDVDYFLSVKKSK